MLEKIYFTKYKSIVEEHKEIEVDTQEFYWKFCDYSNRNIYYGWFVKDDFIYWYEIDNNSVKITKNEVLKWWRDSLYVDIKRVFFETVFLWEIPKDVFMDKVKYFNI